MSNRLLFLYALLLTNIYTNGQEFLWARKPADSAYNASQAWVNTCNSCNGIFQGWSGSIGKRNTTVDAMGNTYVAGSFNGSIKIGNFRLNSSNDNNCYYCGVNNSNVKCFDFFVAKFDSSGNVLWALSAGGNMVDVANSIAVDKDGYVYVGGVINGSNAVDIHFGPNIKLKPQLQDGFIAKISPAGVWVWAHRVYGTYEECVSSVAVDRYGACYIAGSGTGNIRISSSATITTIAAKGKKDIFLIKLDSSGLPVWMRSGGGSEDDYAAHITTDNGGNIYVASNMLTSADFSSGTTNVNIANGTQSYGALIKYTNNGTPLWGIKTGNLAVAVTTDIKGDILLTGVYNTSSIFDTVIFVPYASGYCDVFIAKISPAGNFKWAKRFGSNETKSTGVGQCGVLLGDWSSDIKTDAAGNIYVSGTIVDDTEPSSVVQVTNVKYYPYYNIISKRAGFLIKMTPDGNSSWNLRTKGWWGCDENINGIALDFWGNIYFSGSTYIYTQSGTSSAYYPLAIYLNNDTVPIAEMSSGYVAGSFGYQGDYFTRFRNEEFISIASLNKTSFCVGDSLVVNYTSKGSFQNGNVFHLQLSDSNGEFNTPLILGSINSIIKSGTFRIKIPDTLLMGTNYRVRVISTSTNIIGYMNHQPIIISTYPLANAGTDRIICTNDSVQITGSSGWYYQWNPPYGVSSPNSKSTYLKPQLSQQYVMHTWNPGDCGAYDTVTITTIQRPKSQISGQFSICKRDTAIITVIPGNASHYLWYPSYNITSDTSPVVNVWPLQDTTYILHAYNNYCTDTTMVKIFVKPLPIVSSLKDTSICFKDTLHLTLNLQNTTYLFKPEQYSSKDSNGNVLLFPDTSTTYSVNAVSDAGCFSEKSFMFLNVLPLPTINLIKDTFTCFNETISIQPDSSLYYTWENNPWIVSWDTTGKVIIKAKTSSIYNLKASNLRCSDTASIYIAVYQLPIISAGQDTALCVGQNINLNASGGIKYNWQYSNFITDTSIATPTVFPEISTTFTVKGTDEKGCVGYDSVHVNVLSLPKIITSPDTFICPGERIMLFAGGASSYQWSPDKEINNLKTPSPEIFPQEPRYYTVIGTDLNGCSAKDSISIELKSKPKVYAGNDTVICRGDQAFLVGSGGTFYQWRPASISNEWSSMTTAQPIITTTYILSAKDTNGCSNNDSVTITVKQLPEINASSDKSICEKDSVLLSANSPTGISFEWKNKNGKSVSKTSSFWAKPDVTEEYNVKTFDGSCTSLNEPVNIKVDPLPQSLFKMNINEGIFPLEVKFNEISIGNIAAYLWDFGDSSQTSTEENPVHEFKSPGKYKVNLTTYTNLGCTDDHYKYIFVHNYSDIHIPTAFSPNSDGLNDVFEIVTGEMKTVRIKIFNQWGQLIFERNWAIGQSQLEWDGFYNGSPVQDGVYSYTIEAKGLDDAFRYIIGTVTLVR